MRNSRDVGVRPIARRGRPHFRFDKPGAAFGRDVRVVATLADGQRVSYAIKNGAARND